MGDPFYRGIEHRRLFGEAKMPIIPIYFIFVIEFGASHCEYYFGIYPLIFRKAVCNM